LIHVKARVCEVRIVGAELRGEDTMQIPLRVTFKGMEPSQAINADIRARAERLEHLFSRITTCKVVVAAKNRSHRKGKIYNCSVDITLPGREIVAGRVGPRDHAHEDVHVAIRDAFDAASRRLEDHARRRRADIKIHEAPLHGKIVRIFPQQGYGFVVLSDGQEVYFHENAVVDGKFGHLEVGNEVRLSIAEGESEHGAQATTVTAIGKHHIVE
jgi:cold shock CspA family protein/ribosome-associated translation inhibitor RaiA